MISDWKDGRNIDLFSATILRFDSCFNQFASNCLQMFVILIATRDAVGSSVDDDDFWIAFQTDVDVML